MAKGSQASRSAPAAGNSFVGAEANTEITGDQIEMGKECIVTEVSAMLFSFDRQMVSMSGWKQWFFSVLIGIALSFCAGGLLVDYRYFKAIYGSDVTCPNTRIATLEVKSRVICALICGGDDRCSGSNYLTASGQCQLLKYPCLPGSEKPRAGSIYIERLDNLAAGFTRYFLGGRRPDNGNATEFYWQPSGIPISYSRWFIGQPYAGNDDCNCIMITINTNWLWEDNGCRTYAMYMCQIIYDG
ncbi:hypothetical protein LSH36_1232g00004 [Paralvinella palmiformis]|uniref:C-type lectin domain-containing protein n=1 Tax=Paralvinella palmiformis TaxID=53620 RepID=A0AAD9MP20_9ANNE|nr:hypothetical protein LSH36_1232g00004 [Paralvinella palmiformis]